MFEKIISSVGGKKKVVLYSVCVAAAIVVILLLFAFCSNNGVSNATIKSDLENSRFVENGIISSNYVPDCEYELKSYEIIKRKTDKKNREDDVYCQATISNGYIESEFECRLKYTYYDKGGWILDECYLTDSNNYPKTAPDKEMFDNIRVEVEGKKFELSNMQISSIDFSADRNEEVDEYIAVLKYEYKDETISFVGTLPVKFDGSEGWKYVSEKDFTVNDCTINWNASGITKNQTWSVSGWSYTDSDGKDCRISNVYYVDSNKKSDWSSWHILYIIPWFDAELQIDEIDVQDKKISGKIIINEKESVSNEFSLKNKTLEIPFTSSFNTQNGKFEVSATIDAQSYYLTQPYVLYRRKADGLTVPVDVKFTFKYYGLSSNKWDKENRIEKINVGANDYLTLSSRELSNVLVR